MSEASPWLDVRDASAYARVSDTTVLRAARRGALRGYKVAGGNLWRFRVEDVDAWIERGARPVLYAPKGLAAAR